MNTTLLSSMSLEGMGPSLAIEGSTTRVKSCGPIGKALDALETWEARGYLAHCGYGGLEQHLAKTLY